MSRTRLLRPVALAGASRASLARAVTLMLTLALAACPTEITPGAGDAPGCVDDLDCGVLGQRCIGGSCVAPLPNEGEGEGAGGEGEGEGDLAGGEGEGEGDLAPGEGEGEGEGEGDGGVGAQALVVTAAPQLVDALPGCICNAPESAADVDLSYIGPNGDCRAPADPSCGVDGGSCPCLGFGSGTAAWRASRAEEVRQSELWILEESIAHDGAGDGAFTVRALMDTACLLAPGSVDFGVNHACCMLDCDAGSGGAAACYDYSQGGLSCTTFCQQAVNEAMSVDCMAAGPTPVRVHVEAVGPNGFVREWCLTMTNDQSVDVVQLSRTNGRFTVTSSSPLATEIAVGAACP